jgi:protein-S-isoprenylcysteine O-methyltransferase Ste14
LVGESVAQWLARRRVALGLAAAVIVLVLARPSWASWRIGFIVAAAGEVVRLWAAGHLEKGREVTRSGPYRWTRHPLYVGSTIMAIGIIIAARSTIVGVLSTIYMASTLTAAIRTEEASLTRAFGDTYDRYRESRAEPMRRRFSMARAMRNREYRATAGLVAGFALLALKVIGYL